MKYFVLANCFAYSRLVFVGYLSYFAIGVYWAASNSALGSAEKGIVVLIMVFITTVNCGLILLDGHKAKTALQRG
jgi:hypothetical protein